MDSYLKPLEHSHKVTELERAMMAILLEEFSAQYDSALAQIYAYGKPFLNAPSVVVERFMKQDGLFVLKRPNTSNGLMRVIYSNWRSIASKRGLAFLEFVLTMLWNDDWEIIRLYHPISKAEQYPKFAVPENNPNSFLTSRIRVQINSGVDLREVSELSPTILRLVPANIVPSVSVGFEVDNLTEQVATVIYPAMYCDFMY